MEASGHEPVRKLWATEGELVSSSESLLAIGGMRAETRLKQGVEASGHEPVRKLWVTEGELVSSSESLLAIGGMRAETRLKQGVEPNAQPPVRNRIIFKIRANDDGAVFFLFWAVRQDFIRILRTKCPFLLICP